jgi:isocitrate dehydrogenase (NAD+)
VSDAILFYFSNYGVLMMTLCFQVITKFCSERIAKYAFEYAYLNNRKQVTAVHKANIMKLADGLFLESCREVVTKYPSIKYSEIIVDNCCMQLVSKPEQFDVMVCVFY